MRRAGRFHPTGGCATVPASWAVQRRAFRCASHCPKPFRSSTAFRLRRSLQFRRQSVARHRRTATIKTASRHPYRGAQKDGSFSDLLLASSTSPFFRLISTLIIRGIPRSTGAKICVIGQKVVSFIMIRKIHLASRLFIRTVSGFPVILWVRKSEGCGLPSNERKALQNGH